jgi:hypothetical protein
MIAVRRMGGSAAMSASRLPGCKIAVRHSGGDARRECLTVTLARWLSGAPS